MVLALVMALALWGREASGREIGPDANFCAEVNSVEPGTELVLRPGEYRGPCQIRRGGVEGAPVVVRALDPARPARIVYDGVRSNVLDVRADHVVIRGLSFGPTQPNIDAVRIHARQGIVVEDCRFTDVGGIAVVANHVSGRGLIVRRNVIRDSRSTAMYFGCHDGSCAVTGLALEGNYIHGVSAREGAIGYGIQIKLNSMGVVRDNVIANTKGPGIMVYGATSPERVSVIERNFVMGSRTSSGIVVGGGPAVVRNNVVVENAEAGITLQDYGRRGLLRAVTVAHNTVYGNRAGGIAIAGSFETGTLVNNAIHVRAGTPMLPASRAGLRLHGNVDCGLVGCFRDPHDLDFSPILGGPLYQGSKAVSGNGAPVGDDYLGVPRGPVPTIGALERRAGAIGLGLKP